MTTRTTARKPYAAETTVTVAKSQTELRALLGKYGVERFGIIEEPGLAVVMFQHEGLNHRLALPLRDARHSDFAYSPGGRYRDQKQREAAARQEGMARWRLLVLAVKARLELAAALGQSVGAAFTEYRVLADGRTVQEHITDAGDVPALTWSGS